MGKRNLLFLAIYLVSAASACADALKDEGYGPHPVLPEPDFSLITVVNTAQAKGWSTGEKPLPLSGFTVTAYASDLKHPRWLYVLPDGDVLVAETNAPHKPVATEGLRGFVAQWIQKKAGAGTVSANQITLLRGLDAKGRAATRAVFLKGLNSPFGMALVGDSLYIADTDALLRFPYHEGQTEIAAQGTKVADLPAWPIDHHWTKNVIAGTDGKKLYVTVGSNSNAGENGMENEINRAAILEIDPATGEQQVFASGLRNPNGLAWQPQTGALWTTVNERDEMGDNLPPDYMTAVRQGAFYGWPYSYYGQHVDTRVEPLRPDLVAKAVAPDYALGNHTAALGLAFYVGSQFPAQYRDGVFIGMHGSWNRRTRTGYKVAFVPFRNGKPAGMPEDFLTGFLDKDGNALGRPVGVVVDKQGALLVADDVGNTIWRVTYGK